MVFRRRRFGYKKRGKRWYFNAGANLPFVGRTNVSFGTGSKQKRSMYNIAKKVVRSTVEPKRFIYNINGVTDTTQNTIYTHNISQLIAKGTDDHQRIGERIHLKNLFVSMTAIAVNQGLEPQVYDKYPKQYRLLVLKARQEHTGTDWISGFGSTELFEHEDSVSPNPNHFMKGPIQKENVTVLASKTVTFHKSSDDSGMYRTFNQQVFNVPLNMSFQYNDVSTSILGKWYNLYLVLIPHIPGGSTAASMESEFNLAYHLNWSDTK